jgi:RimJ/RimL family protein N-acetyltransferase
MLPLPLRTARLEVRLMAPGDAQALARYRSLPEVARHQSWETPFTVEQARAMLADQQGLAGPMAGRWVQLAVEQGGEVVGDVAVHLSDDGATAEIGFTMHPAQQGRGFATEAAGAVVDGLLVDGVHRVEASVAPMNHASRRVLEHLGFRLEGVARQAFRGREGWEDDERWSLLAHDRRARLARRGPPETVRLVELAGAARPYGRLRTQPTQERFVATVWESYADALFPDVDDDGGRLLPWLRGIEADGEPAGFVMTAEPTPTSPVPYLWRLLVDREHQGRGIGQRVIAMLAARYREAGYEAMLTSWVDEPGGPEPFYRALGFVPTGEVDDGEVVARLPLRAE